MLIYKVMNKSFWLSCTLLFLLITLSSCSHAPATKITGTVEETLRYSIIQKEGSVNWTKAMEENRLLEKIDTYEGIDKTVRLSMDVFKAYRNPKDPVYPYIENFGNLDITNLSTIYKQQIRYLFQVLNTDLNNLPENLINNKYLFNYIFFKNDLLSEWKSNYNLDYPSTNAFTKYLIGEPFISKELVQIPVRLYHDKGIVDICVYIIPDENSLISQIEIIGMKNENR